LGTRRSTTGLLSADRGERSNERRGREFLAADGGELGSDLNGPPLLLERGVDGAPTLLLLEPPGVEGRWLEVGVEGRGLDDGVDGRWLEDGVLGLPLLTGDPFGPDLPMATHHRIKNQNFPTSAPSKATS
jgi:hypothetical protein